MSFAKESQRRNAGVRQVLLDGKSRPVAVVGLRFGLPVVMLPLPLPPWSRP